MSFYNGPTIVTNGLVLSLDAADRNSYPGSGTTWRNMSGQGNNATLVNGPTFDTESGGNIVTDGTNDYINVASSNTFPVGASARTIELWFKPLDSLTTNFLWHYGSQEVRRSFGARRNGATGINYFTWSDDLDYTGTIATNSWGNLVHVYDGNTTISAYNNASFIASKNVGLNTTQTDITISAYPAFSFFHPYGKNKISIFKIYNRALSAAEILQNYNATCTRFGLLPIYNIPIVQGSIAGLFGRRYVGYFNDSVTWFASATLHGDTQQTTQIDNFSSNADSYSWMWLGYFYSPSTGNYTFYTNSDDASYLWVGSNAISGYTTGNALVNNGGLHGAQERSGTISLTGGVYNPIRIMFGENGGGDIMTVSFEGPSISKRTNGSGYYFDGSVSLFSTWG